MSYAIKICDTVIMDVLVYTEQDDNLSQSFHLDYSLPDIFQGKKFYYRMSLTLSYFSSPTDVPESPHMSPDKSHQKRSRLPSTKWKVSTRLGV